MGVAQSVFSAHSPALVAQAVRTGGAGGEAEELALVAEGGDVEAVLAGEGGGEFLRALALGRVVFHAAQAFVGDDLGVHGGDDLADHPDDEDGGEGEHDSGDDPAAAHARAEHGTEIEG